MNCGSSAGIIERPGETEDFGAAEIIATLSPEGPIGVALPELHSIPIRVWRGSESFSNPGVREYPALLIKAHIIQYSPWPRHGGAKRSLQRSPYSARRAEPAIIALRLC